MDVACVSCQKSPPEVVLKHCAKCSTTPYCSRDCQKTDWKTHKKICGRGSTAGEANRGPTAPASKAAIDRPFTRLDKGTWLHDRPHNEVFGLLIDAYRLRLDDMYRIEGDVDSDSLYGRGGADAGLRGLRRFLDAVASRPGLLPPWWDASQRKACEDLSMDESQSFYVGHAVEKSDIIKFYGDSQFPMQLRMFGEAVYGSAPGGTNGSGMRKMMMAMEQGLAGGIKTTMMDMSSLFPGRR